MARAIYSLIPNPEDLLALEPEELAGVILEHFNTMTAQELHNLHRGNFSLHYTVEGYPQAYHIKTLRALMEAWAWLEREGLIAERPSGESSSGQYFITRRGEKIKQAADLEAYRRADMLPRRLLHPVIAQLVWANFLHGDYDTAVFQAFKEVEVAVRVAGNYTEADYGTDLMRKAFHLTSGNLTDSSLLKGEQQAMSDLFAGASGMYRNPTAHRYTISDPTEAVELIMLASRLRKIIDSRVASTSTATAAPTP
jgi:uncharacterized protein (TIGR02391 family)